MADKTLSQLIGGDSGSQIDSLALFHRGEVANQGGNNYDDIIIVGAETWLKTGVVETDTGLYPEARTNKGLNLFTGFSVSTSNSYGLAFDGTAYYLVQSGSNTVLVYNNRSALESNTLSSSFPLSAGNASPRGIAFNGTNLFVIDFNDRVYEYTTAGSAVTNVPVGGLITSVAGSYTASGISWDGSRFWFSNRNASATHVVSLNAALTSTDLTVPIGSEVESNGSHGTPINISGELHVIFENENNATLNANNIFVYDAFSGVFNDKFAIQQIGVSLFDDQSVSGTDYILSYGFTLPTIQPIYIGNYVGSTNEGKSDIFPYYIRVS